MRALRVMLSGAAVLALAACGDQASQPLAAGTGPTPQLPAPKKTALPTVDIAPAKGWRANATPIPMQGMNVASFADSLDHPRWIYTLPNGDVLVAETNAPERPEEEKGLKNWIMGMVMKRAGTGVPSANRITLLRDSDGNGTVDERSVFLSNLNSPFGMALIGNTFYVANTDAIVKFPYADGQTTITAAPVKVADLPAGPRNHHWTKNIVASLDGTKLYATVGSNSNAAENGIEAETNRAAILEVDAATGATRLFASGLRNPNGMGWEPLTGALWTSVNERDELGSDLVPDYMTSVKDGGFYGWPYSYYGQHVDERVKPQRDDLVQKAIVPDYALGPHTASLGFVFSRPSNALPPAMGIGAFIGQHGSWNRTPLSGYRVLFVPFTDGKPSGPPVDVLTGFVDEDGKALGRPVGVALDRTGALLVADDVGNRIWRVTGAHSTPRVAQP